jgi:integrase
VAEKEKWVPSSLTWEMVDWKGRMLNIPRTKNEEPIHVPLNDAALTALRVVHGLGHSRGRVFQSTKTGEPLENGRHWFDDAVIAAEIKNFRWHDLRHYVREPAANERCSARGYCRSFRTQKFDDDQTIRAFGSEQIACGGILARSKGHHN